VIARASSPARRRRRGVVFSGVCRPGGRELRARTIEHLDEESAGWVASLGADGAARERRLPELHALLLRAARHETRRRRAWLGGAGERELDDIAHQAASDAVLAVMAKLDSFRGASRFTTWAYKFVVYEVSVKMRRHQWSGRPLPGEQDAVERAAARLAPGPDVGTEQREAIAALKQAMDEVLTDHQRKVFVALALNDVPADGLAAILASNRNALYKTLHDARRKLRAHLEAAGHAL